MNSSVTCHLVRSDGSRWIVTELSRGLRGTTVCAVRPPDNGAGDGRRALWRARLQEGDRLEWRTSDGEVLSASAGLGG